MKWQINKVIFFYTVLTIVLADPNVYICQRQLKVLSMKHSVQSSRGFPLDAGKNVEEELERSKIPIKNLPEDFLWMQVKGGSKMNNLLAHASGILEDKGSTAVVWTGAGVAIAKAISCAEILKRQFSIEHQLTKLTYKSVEEFWEPSIDGLETIVVKRQIPVIHIFLSLDDVPDTNQIGYQSLKGKLFWQKEESSQSKQHQGHRNKKPFKYKKAPLK